MNDSELYLEVEELMGAGVLEYDPDWLKVFTLVASARAPQETIEYACEYVEAVKKKYPAAKLVVGDSSKLEKEAATTAEMLGMRLNVVKKNDWWSDSATAAAIRDESVCSQVGTVIAFDDSARSKHYREIAKRTCKRYVRRKP